MTEKSIRRTLSEYEMDAVRSFSEWQRNGVSNFEDDDPELFAVSAEVVDTQFKALSLMTISAMNRIVGSYRQGDPEAGLIIQTLFEWNKAYRNQQDSRTIDQFITDEKKTPNAFIMLGIKALNDPEASFQLNIGEVKQLDLYFGVISYTSEPVVQE